MKHALLILLAIALCGCTTTRYKANTLAAFQKAAVVDDWTTTLPADGVTARLKARGGPGGNATLRYSDESEARTVYQYSDYLYVSQVRHDTNSMLYVKVSGVAMGIWPETLVIPFDLKTRCRLEPVKIKE
jgi:hypothetical protein